MDRTENPPLDQFWECPKCGTQFAMGVAKLYPPTCRNGHEATEMEQITAPRFGEAA